MEASPPPPAPKIEPMNAVTAMTSLTVAGGWVEPALRHELALRDRSAALIEPPAQPTR